MSSTTIFSFRRKPRIFFRRDRRPFMAMVKYSTITRLLSQLVLGFLTATSHSIREIVALSKRQIYIFNIFSYDIWWSRKYCLIFSSRLGTYVAIKCFERQSKCSFCHVSALQPPIFSISRLQQQQQQHNLRRLLLRLLLCSSQTSRDANSIVTWHYQVCFVFSRHTASKCVTLCNHYLILPVLP
jgi:hypothetical protein